MGETGKATHRGRPVGCLEYQLRVLTVLDQTETLKFVNSELLSESGCMLCVLLVGLKTIILHLNVIKAVLF